MSSLFKTLILLVSSFLLILTIFKFSGFPSNIPFKKSSLCVAKNSCFSFGKCWANILPSSFAWGGCKNASGSSINKILWFEKLEGEIIDLGSEINVLEKSGAWYAYNGEKVGQGKENVKIWLKENPKLKEKMENDIRKHYNI